MPLVSIIVPVYRVEKVVHYCINSILNQSFIDFELLLIDDGSPDNSGKICDDYAIEDSRIKVIHKDNEGVSAARNTGIKLSQGKYICFIDSDDYVAENYLEELINAKNDNLDADSIWCGFQTVTDYDGSNLKINLASEKEEISFYYKSQFMTLQEKWLLQMPWNKLFNRKVIVENNIRFPEDISLGEDLIFNLHYLDNLNGKIAIINKPLNFYIRNGNESLDNKYYPNLFEIYKKINFELYKYLTKWECDISQFISYYNSCFYKYERVLRNTFHVNSKTKKKYQYNKFIMKTNEFKTVLNNSNCFIHPLYKFGYKHASYMLIRFLDKLLSIKSR